MTSPASPSLQILARKHPFISSAILLLPLLGMVGCVIYIPDWSLLRRLAAGLVGGLFIGFIITATHVVRIIADQE